VDPRARAQVLQAHKSSAIRARTHTHTHMHHVNEHAPTLNMHSETDNMLDIKFK